jgi:hypothetical protein
MSSVAKNPRLSENKPALIWTNSVMYPTRSFAGNLVLRCTQRFGGRALRARMIQIKTQQNAMQQKSTVPGFQTEQSLGIHPCIIFATKSQWLFQVSLSRLFRLLRTP